MKFYIATGFERKAEHNLVRDQLLAAGHQLTYDWTLAGDAKYLDDEGKRQIADSEAAGAANVDYLAVLLPGGFGTHGELGIAIGAAIATGKKTPVFIHAPGGLPEKVCIFYFHSNVQIFHGELKDFANFVIDKMNKRAILRTIA